MTLAALTRVAQLIRMSRRKLQIKTRDAAGQLGLCRSYLAQLETGKRPFNPRWDTLIAIATLYQIDVGDLWRLHMADEVDRLAEEKRQRKKK